MLRRTFIKLAATGSAGLCVPAFAKNTGAASLVSHDGDRTVVVDSPNHRVSLRFADDREHVVGEFGMRPGSFNWPRAAVLRGNRLFVADAGNSRIQVFDRDGVLIRTFGKYGRGHGELAHASGIAVTEDGVLIVADTLNHRLVRYREDGTVLGYFGKGLNAPRTVVIDGAGALHVTDYRRTSIVA